MKMKTFMMILAASLVCSAAFAQDKGDSKKSAPKKAVSGAPAMPKPAPEMKDLWDLVGTWTGEETDEQTPFMPAGTATATNTVRPGPGKFTVLMDHRSKMASGMTFTGHGVLTWDPNDKAYKMVWMDSMTPGVLMSTGKKDGDSLVFTSDVTMMGKKMAMKDVVSDRTPTSYTLTSYYNDGSGEKKSMTIKFTKQEAPAAPAKK
jgi:hypothetical protein